MQDLFDPPCHLAYIYKRFYAGRHLETSSFVEEISKENWILLKILTKIYGYENIWTPDSRNV